MFVHAQQGMWTWMNGTQANLQPPVHGTQGVSSPANTPGWRYEAMRWTDKQGNLWLFGGQSALGATSDLWKYDITTNEWTWMNGPNLAYPATAYTTQGVFSAANFPAFSIFGSVEFTDNDGNFWYLEGDGMQNLWKYDVSINQWAWMHGPGTVMVPPVYGTQNVFAPANQPSGTNEHHIGWCDTLGNLWMYGGYTNNPLSSCSDVLWKYDTQINQWCWVFGTPNTLTLPVHGTQDVPAATNTPGARNGYACWLSSDNRLCLWGSGGYCGLGYYNDLWSYDIPANTWTWIAGSPALQNGLVSAEVSGSNCQSAPGFFPDKGDETHTNAQWGNCDLFYIYGGALQGVATNSLWQYNVRTDEWARLSINPANQAVYGTFQTPAANVHPGNHFGSVGWTDIHNRYWVIGNQDPDYTSVMMCYTPFEPVAAFTGDTLLCAGTAAAFYNNSTSPCALVSGWTWDFGDPASGSSNTSALENPQHIYNAPGFYTVTLISRSCGDANDTVQQTVHIIGAVANAGPDVLICPQDSALLAATGGTSYTWLPATGLSSSSISNPVASPVVTTTYTVEITVSGCTSRDSVLVTVRDVSDPACTDLCMDAASVPNVFSPDNDGMNDRFEIPLTCPASIHIFDRWGRTVWESAVTSGNGWNGTNQANNKPVSDGTYYYVLTTSLNGTPRAHTGFVTVVRK